MQMFSISICCITSVSMTTTRRTLNAFPIYMEGDNQLIGSGGRLRKARRLRRQPTAVLRGTVRFGLVNPRYPSAVDGVSGNRF